MDQQQQQPQQVVYIPEPTSTQVPIWPKVTDKMTKAILPVLTAFIQSLPSLQSPLISVGFNTTLKALQRGMSRLVILAIPQHHMRQLFEVFPQFCALYKTPVLILTLDSYQLGELFNVHTAACVSINLYNTTDDVMAKGGPTCGFPGQFEKLRDIHYTLSLPEYATKTAYARKVLDELLKQSHQFELEWVQHAEGDFKAKLLHKAQSDFKQTQAKLQNTQNKQNKQKNVQQSNNNTINNDNNTNKVETGAINNNKHKDVQDTKNVKDNQIKSKNNTSNTVQTDKTTDDSQMVDIPPISKTGNKSNKKIDINSNNNNTTNNKQNVKVQEMMTDDPTLSSIPTKKTTKIEKTLETKPTTITSSASAATKKETKKKNVVDTSSLPTTATTTPNPFGTSSLMGLNNPFAIPTGGVGKNQFSTTTFSSSTAATTTNQQNQQQQQKKKIDVASLLPGSSSVMKSGASSIGGMGMSSSSLMMGTSLQQQQQQATTTSFTAPDLSVKKKLPPLAFGGASSATTTTTTAAASQPTTTKKVVSKGKTIIGKK